MNFRGSLFPSYVQHKNIKKKKRKKRTINSLSLCQFDAGRLAEGKLRSRTRIRVSKWNYCRTKWLNRHPTGISFQIFGCCHKCHAGNNVSNNGESEFGEWLYGCVSWCMHAVGCNQPFRHGQDSKGLSLPGGNQTKYTCVYAGWIRYNLCNFFLSDNSSKLVCFSWIK